MSAANYSVDLLQREYDDRAPVRAALRAVMDHYHVEGQQVVELGSGLGYNLEIFSGINSVTGVEGLPMAAQAASARGVTTLAADLAGPIPLQSQSYHLVLCLDVLEHLVHPEWCLTEAHRILLPDGLLVVNVPNHFSLAGRLNIMLGSGIDSAHFFQDCADWENPHVRFFRHASISSLLRRCGFTLEADWSARFPSVPVLNKVRFFRESGFARALAGHAPELFAGGFFMVARKAATLQC